MKVVISGSTGLIGKPLVRRLQESGHEVVRLVRGSPQGPGTSLWRPSEGDVDKDVIRSADAVVHLAGESIASWPWTDTRKNRIRSSRMKSTRLLVDAMRGSSRKILLCASGIGYYGHRPDEKLTEEAQHGEGFLADVCVEWEKTAALATEHNARVVSLRTGIVLSANGGFLAKILLPFRFGLGGTVGTGDQVMSWVSLDDVVQAYVFALESDAVRGPLNVTAPNPVTNRVFTETFGRVLHRPTVIPVPTFALRTLLGEMADELMLTSAYVVSDRLIQAGFEFREEELENALSKALG